MGEPHDFDHVVGAHHRARRIRRRVQNDELRLRRDESFNHLRGHAEALRFVGFEQYTIPTDVADHIFEAHPGRHRQKDFVAMIDQHRDHVKQRVLATDRGAYFLAFVGGAEIGGVAVDDRILQFKRAADGGVLRKIGIDRGDGGVFHMLRRGEVRLTGGEVDDVDALLAQLVGFGRGGHGGRRLDPVDAFRQADGVGNGSQSTAHDFFILFFLALVLRVGNLRSTSSTFTNLSAGSIFSRSFCATSSGTRQSMLPPS